MMIATITDSEEALSRFLRTINLKLKHLLVKDVSIKLKELEVPSIKVTNYELQLVGGEVKRASLGVSDISKDSPHIEVTCPVGLHVAYQNWHETYDAIYERENQQKEDKELGVAYFTLDHIPIEIKLNTETGDSEIAIPEYRYFMSYLLPEETVINHHHYCTHGVIQDHIVEEIRAFNLENLISSAIKTL